MTKETQQLSVQSHKGNTNQKRGIFSRVDFGTLECERCLQGRSYKKAHHFSCHRNQRRGGYRPPDRKLIASIIEEDPFFFQNLDGAYRENFILRNIFDRDFLFPGEERTPMMYGDITPDAISSNSMPHEEKDKEKVLAVDDHKTLKKNLEPYLYQKMTPDLLKAIISAVMTNWSEQKKEKLAKIGRIPLPILAIIEYIYMQIPRYRNVNEETGKLETENMENCISWYKEHFPRGVLAFTIPDSGRKLGETIDIKYESVAGTTIHITRWDLNTPDIKLNCTCGGTLAIFCNGKSVFSNITPIFKLDGRTDFEFGTALRCKDCEKVLKSSDSAILQSLPKYLLATFPVSPNFSRDSINFLLHRSVTACLEKEKVPFNLVSWVSEQIYTSQKNLYQISEASYRTNYDNDIDRSKIQRFPTLSEWRGQCPPSPTQLFCYIKTLKTFSSSTSSRIQLHNNRRQQKATKIEEEAEEIKECFNLSSKPQTQLCSTRDDKPNAVRTNNKMEEKTITAISNKKLQNDKTKPEKKRSESKHTAMRRSKELRMLLGPSSAMSSLICRPISFSPNLISPSPITMTSASLPQDTATKSETRYECECERKHKQNGFEGKVIHTIQCRVNKLLAGRIN